MLGLIFIVVAGLVIFFGLKYWKTYRYKEEISDPPTPFKLGAEVPPPPACMQMRKVCLARGETPPC